MRKKNLINYSLTKQVKNPKDGLPCYISFIKMELWDDLHKFNSRRQNY